VPSPPSRWAEVYNRAIERSRRIDVTEKEPPPGWYPTAGGQRYWDGARWTEHYAPPPQLPAVVQVQSDGGQNSALAPVTSLVCGLVALLGCSWVPFIQLGALLLGPLAIIFGILGLQRGQAEHKLMSVIGIVTGGVALALAFILLALIGDALDDSDRDTSMADVPGGVGYSVAPPPA